MMAQITVISSGTVLKSGEKIRNSLKRKKSPNLFEISYLNIETVRSFKSDFRFVAEYFVSTQRVKDGLDPIFEVTADHLRHVEEFIDLMNSLTKTRRFDALKYTITRGGELPMMTYMFDEAEARGKAAGIAEGEAKGRAEEESMFMRLTEKLLSLGKIEELQKATTDRLFKEKLYSVARTNLLLQRSSYPPDGKSRLHFRLSRLYPMLIL